MKFRCSKCRELHDTNQLSFGADAPMQWELLTDLEQANSELAEDQCVIESSEGTSFYIRAILDIPVIGKKEPYTWGVWCSLSENSFIEVYDHWDDPERQKIGPHFGWLCTKLPVYPDTMYLKTMVHQRAVGLRPRVIIEESDHPLSIHQRKGIDPDMLKNILIRALHEAG